MKIFRRRKFEGDMDTELGFHLDAHIDDVAKPGDSSAWTSFG
jgi:hypothetical protein